MATDLATLSTDHRRFSRLLDLFDRHIENFHKGETEDHQVMLEIVRYMTEYTDTYHHPKEDLMMQRLVRLDPTFRCAADELVRQHERIASAGDRLLNALKAVVAEDIVPRAAVEEAARQYTVSMRKHMEIEEEKLFPAAMRLLREVDWDAINALIARCDDPLFDACGEQRYQALFEHIAA
jgi:hemerythrin-like domain-containing protein